MVAEAWAALGASLLLAIAGLSRGVGLSSGRMLCDLIAIGARALGACALVLALVLTATSYGLWSPTDPRQTALTLALATTCVHLLCTWQEKVDGAGPAADLLTLALALWGAFGLPANGSWTACASQSVPFYAQWSLLFLGGGAVTVSGCTGLMQVVYGRSVAHHGEVSSDLRDQSAPLRRATGLAVIGLGGGLTTAVWSTWRTAGSLSSGDLREGWLAVSWMVAAMSLISWQMPGRSRGRAAALAIVSGAIAIFGLFAATGLHSPSGV